MTRQRRMKSQFGKVQIRRNIKDLIQRLPGAESALIRVYHWGGAKPWSLGYSAYKRRKIRLALENDLGYFHGGSLPDRYGNGLDERIVEYPWFFSRLKSSETVLLDAGAALNHSEILESGLLQNKQLHIMTLHPEIEYRLPLKPSYHYGDFRNAPFQDGYFDAIVCISSLEHVGMDNTFLYGFGRAAGDGGNQSAFLEAVREFHRMLKKQGTLYVTVPYGAYADHRWFQIFSAKMVEALKNAFQPACVHERYYRYDADQWALNDALACDHGQYFDIHNEQKPKGPRVAAAECVACLELVK